MSGPRGPSGVINVRDYGCAKVLRLLDSYLAGELTVETNHEILEHLARCLDCPGELAAREKLRDAVRRVAARAEEPSPGFEQRLHALISRTPPPRRVPVPAMLLAAAVLCGAAGLAVVSWRGLQRSTPAGSAVVRARFDAGALPAATRTQTNCALRIDWRRHASPLPTLEQTLGPPYGAALGPLAARMPGYTVLTAHKCAHGGREVVHLIFAKDGDPSPAGLVSAIVMPRRAPLPDERLAVVEHLRTDDDRSVAVASAREGGFDVSVVQLANVDVFVVSSRGAKESLELGRAILPALATAAIGR
ncbi:MAG TPA: zf-HC2 domain-containing protein [Thermoanaerobaculia bacterium]|nr:zf-HC2 domain-containing protein [Thermoanaerobaculia bacterium]